MFHNIHIQISMERIPKGDIITQQFRVKQPCGLLDFLIENQIKKSKNAIQSVLRRRLITVNGKMITQFDHPLKVGDKVAVMKTDQAKKVQRLKGMTIVYEDDRIIVIDKEAGLLSVATDKEQAKTVYAILTQYVKKKKDTNKIFVVHRLDREVSGLMVFAKDLDTQGKFQRNWSFVVPVYNMTAIVNGPMPAMEGTIRSWLTENKNFQVFSDSYDNGGLEAITHYKVLKSNEHYSYVEFRQETKRKNQIRAQMQQLQRPIVNDRKYGATSTPLRKIALHASTMKIKHPGTGRMMDFNSPISKEALKLVNKAAE